MNITLESHKPANNTAINLDVGKGCRIQVGRVRKLDDGNWVSWVEIGGIRFQTTGPTMLVAFNRMIEKIVRTLEDN